ncbi:hypothetical protein PoB_005262800 [Plakobranchus ocellatus]|uniref:Uncharacterized protein n=1 Tax=Plakobranchus ocellatus TaxID=259542 RepID=A0AAV4C2I9_9GAST|nr:hypothetical protein PoB_005262800 [Plakobranchus ocellatus]
MEISESGLKTRQLTTCTLHAFSCPRGMEPDYRRCICVKATSSQVQQQPYNPQHRQLPSQVPQPGCCPSDMASYDSNARTCRCFDTGMVYDPNLLTCGFLRKFNAEATKVEKARGRERGPYSMLRLSAKGPVPSNSIVEVELRFL